MLLMAAKARRPSRERVTCCPDDIKAHGPAGARGTG